MPENDSDRRNSSAAEPSDVAKRQALERKGAVFLIDEIRKKREQLEEAKHIKAIIDLVRHYK